MAKLTEKDIEEIKDILSLGCDYADTKTVVYETVDDTLRDMGINLGIECMLVVDGEYEDSIGLDEFVDKFYSNMIEKILNVVATQE